MLVRTQNSTLRTILSEIELLRPGILSHAHSSTPELDQVKVRHVVHMELIELDEQALELPPKARWRGQVFLGNAEISEDLFPSIQDGLWKTITTICPQQPLNNSDEVVLDTQLRGQMSLAQSTFSLEVVA